MFFTTGLLIFTIASISYIAEPFFGFYDDQICAYLMVVGAAMLVVNHFLPFF
jgi:hypothetical protein